jgi:hypothetical protein
MSEVVARRLSRRVRHAGVWRVCGVWMIQGPCIAAGFGHLVVQTPPPTPSVYPGLASVQTRPTPPARTRVWVGAAANGAEIRQSQGPQTQPTRQTRHGGEAEANNGDAASSKWGAGSGAAP